VGNVVASSGTALTAEQVRVLGRQVASLILCFDGDPAGKRATERAVDLAAAEGMAARICLLPEGLKDPDEVVRSDPAAFARAIAEAPPEWSVLLEWAIGPDEGGSIEARRAALGRALPVLLRIPEAATRELYVGQVARRFDLRVDAVAADLARVQKRGPRQAARVIASIPEASVVGERDDEIAPQNLTAWEAYLGGIVLQRPALGHRLVEVHGLDVAALTHEPLRNLVVTVLSLAPGESLQTHSLPPAERRLAARLMLRVIPEVADGVPDAQVERALAENMARLTQAARQTQLAEIDRELARAHDEGREEDIVRLVAAKHAVHQAIHGGTSDAATKQTSRAGA